MHIINLFHFKILNLDLIDKKAFTKLKLFFDKLSDSFFKVFSIKSNFKSKKVFLNFNEGIMETGFMKSFHKEINKFILNHNDIIFYMKVFRNKIQHNYHLVDFYSIGGANDSFSLSYRFSRNESESYEIDSKYLDSLIIDLNKLIILLLKNVEFDSHIISWISESHTVLFDTTSYLRINEWIKSRVNSNVNRYMTHSNFLIDYLL
jgi:hypothetical protein